MCSMFHVPQSFSRGDHPVIEEAPLPAITYDTGSQPAPSGVKLESAAIPLKQD